MDLMFDHRCRKELTLAEQDEDERDKAVQSYNLAVLIKCTVSSGPYILARLMLL